ncbi:MAG: ROK family protein, partial [Chloroflexota bacterium]
FNPELVVLGGGVTRAGARLLDPVRAAGLAQAMAPARASADVVLSVLGDGLGVVGAACVAFDVSPALERRVADQTSSVS